MAVVAIMYLLFSTEKELVWLVAGVNFVLKPQISSWLLCRCRCRKKTHFEEAATTKHLHFPPKLTCLIYHHHLAQDRTIFHPPPH